MVIKIHNTKINIAIFVNMLAFLFIAYFNCNYFIVFTNTHWFLYAVVLLVVKFFSIICFYSTFLTNFYKIECYC